MSEVTALGAGLDGVEGPSEPIAASPDVLAQFWSAFADLVNGQALRPIVGAVGSAALTSGAGGTDGFCATATAMQPKTFDWWWSFHAHSPITQDLATEGSPTFGFRQIQSDCTLTGRPLVVSEAGPANRPWASTDGPWLAFFDAQLALDADVRGAALAAAGLSQVETDLLNALTNGPAAADGGVDGGAADGGGGGVVPGDGTSPGGPLVPVHTKGCSCGSPGAAALAILPVLFAIRRRSRRA